MHGYAGSLTRLEAIEGQIGELTAKACRIVANRTGRDEEEDVLQAEAWLGATSLEKHAAIVFNRIDRWEESMEREREALDDPR